MNAYETEQVRIADLIKLLETYRKLCLTQHRASSIGLWHTLKSDRNVIRAPADARSIDEVDNRLRTAMKGIVMLIATRTENEFCVNCGALVEYAGIELVEDCKTSHGAS